MNVIEAVNLEKMFDSFRAVDRISFQVTKGECFGILGPNGAGKTTTIRMAYGFSPITAGALRVFGMDIRRDWRKIKARIGVCQQDNSLDAELTVLENLEVFARFFDMNRESARSESLKLLEFIALEHRRDSQVADLSGGMLRRLMLARSLINRPELLILDEPTTGLDPQSRHQIWERLEGLRKEGISILLTTHYMEEAARLCDRLIIMDHGHILVEGSPQELVQKYAGSEIIEIADPDDQLRSYLKAHGLEYEDLGQRLIIYCEDRDSVYQEIKDEYCRAGCLLRMATLEDVFLKLTGRELRE